MTSDQPTSDQLTYVRRAVEVATAMRVDQENARADLLLQRTLQAQIDEHGDEAVDELVVGLLSLTTFLLARIEALDPARTALVELAAVGRIVAGDAE